MSNFVKNIAIIDIGHGGTDPGAIGINGIKEKDCNYQTAIGLKKKLESKGVKVYLTRSNDSTVSLSERVNLANRIAKDNPNSKIIFISIHHNAGGGDRSECIHSIYRGEGLRAAELIGGELQSHLGQAKKIYEKRGSDNKDYYYVIKNTSMNAIIVEVAFLDNINDVKICDTVEEQQRNGEVIGCGVLKWFGLISSCNDTQSKPSNPTTSNLGNFGVGAKVKIKGNNYATGQSVPSWVKQNTYTITQIKDNKALLSDIVSWVYISDLTLIQGTSGGSTPKEIKVGSKVKVIGDKYSTGQTVPSWVKQNVYTVTQLGDKGALLSDIVSWIKLDDLKLI